MVYADRWQQMLDDTRARLIRIGFAPVVAGDWSHLPSGAVDRIQVMVREGYCPVAALQKTVLP